MDEVDDEVTDNDAFGVPLDGVAEAEADEGAAAASLGASVTGSWDGAGCASDAEVDASACCVCTAAMVGSDVMMMDDSC